MDYCQINYDRIDDAARKAAATGAGMRPAPSEAGYRICMLATACAVLFWLLVIRG